jgi:hypothetical protein
MLAWVDAPGKLVLNATKSVAQLAVVTLNENFAGYCPPPTVAPVPMFCDQSRFNLRFLGVREPRQLEITVPSTPSSGSLANN